ncbi:3'-5' exonuclease [Helicobacter marmotae]|uniref:3'-5' exonuclease n=1 Tax=Helicobacter marmotae TaxID=152490 RepID=A0A3D8I323_9HELI|nr:3'-5' exonuclease [Helicobacter marmotae]RDU59543.1 3'-5' exonuclease [Helicobacter marmotae]
MTYSQLFERLRLRRLEPMSKKQFYMYIKSIGGLYADLDSELELLKGCGAPLDIEVRNDGMYFSLNTFKKLWRESDLVFVDIETNGSKPKSSDIIEIGAIKTRNGEIIESFESFVYAACVPEVISNLTGITSKDIAHAPKKKEVLAKFRTFLGDSVFVAHNVNFDYNFLDIHLRKCGMFGLLNPKLCTIELAQRTIPARRYGLSYLNDFLGIHTPVSHRAYADALTSFEIFKIAMLMFPFCVVSVQDLIDFSKHRL